MYIIKFDILQTRFCGYNLKQNKKNANLSSYFGYGINIKQFISHDFIHVVQKL